MKYEKIEIKIANNIFLVRIYSAFLFYITDTNNY